MSSSDSVFRALADPTRRGILHLLRNGPMPSGDIAARFPTAWSTISRHLAVLREAGLVLVEREGTVLRYELNTTVMQELVKGLLDLTARRDGARAAEIDEGSLDTAARQTPAPRATTPTTSTGDDDA